MVTLEVIRFYNSLGWPLFPCRHKDGEGYDGKAKEAKSPLAAHGFKDATTDLAKLEAWHEQYPGCAWGTPTSSGRGVFDIDPKHGGDITLAKLILEHGPMPSTPSVRTGSNGYHYWLRFPPGTRDCKPYPGIDVKAIGGYVIVPPSRIDIPAHEGRSYLWEAKPWEVALADAPAWVLGTPKAEGKAKAEARRPEADPWIVQASGDDLLTHPGSPAGERRATFCRLVGVHLARGDSEASLYKMASAWASRCTPPFDGSADARDDWQQHLEGLLRKEAGRIHTNSEGVGGGELVCFLPASAGAEGCPAAPVGQADRQGVSLFASQTSAEAEPEPEGGEEKPETPVGVSSSWPTLSPEAYHGLLGEMLTAITPETEADPAGVLLGWLTCFGNVVGRGAWVQVGPRLHHPALYVGIVGRTSDAKGDSWACGLWPFREVEPAWAARCIANGIGSGEGLVERIADDSSYIGKDGEAVLVPGASDKRCLVRLSELSKCFKVGRRDSSTLSEMLREAWDGEAIAIPNRKGNALATSGYAVGIVGDITPGVIRKALETGTEAFDGWANRWLWAAVKGRESLPFGGEVAAALRPFLERLGEALAFGKAAGCVGMDDEAKAVWKAAYNSLRRSADEVPHTDRARPYAMRLAMLYALADRSNVVKLEHLQAALAVWAYCRESAAKAFGVHEAKAEAPPDPLSLRLLNAITANPGINRSGLREVVGSKVKGEAIGEALAWLEAQGHAYHEMVQPRGGGRPAELWYPGRPRPEDDTQKRGSAFSHQVPGSANSGSKQTNSADGDGSASASAEVWEANKLTRLKPVPGELVCLLPAAATAEGKAEAVGFGVSLFPSRADTLRDEAGQADASIVGGQPAQPVDHGQGEGIHGGGDDERTVTQGEDGTQPGEHHSPASRHQPHGLAGGSWPQSQGGGDHAIPGVAGVAGDGPSRDGAASGIGAEGGMLASGSGQGLGVDAKGTTNLPTLALSHMSSGGIGIGGSVKAEAISDEDRAILQDDFLDNL